MFYIYARRRDDLTKYYWNRRKNEWQLDLAPSCYYPTRAGVKRIHAGIVNAGLIWRRFHEIGWNLAPGPEARRAQGAEPQGN